MNLYHNSHNLFYRRPFGAATCGSEIMLRLKISELPDFSDSSFSVFLCTFFGDLSEDVPMESFDSDGDSALFDVVLSVPDYPGLLFYFFRVECPEGTYYYGNNPERLGGKGCSYDYDPVPFQITVYKQDTVPTWYTGGIAYQIFPDRFARSEDYQTLQSNAQKSYYEGISRSEDLFFPSREVQKHWEDVPYYPRNIEGGVSSWIFAGGSLDGIRLKLDYLKNLGVTILYINPIFKASSNHKYDTFDYMQIDEAFGDKDSFCSLCREAKKRGIHIILDGVFNHTGADSIYFNLFGREGYNGACQGEDSPYYPWYTFTEEGYESWWGVRDLPNVNEMNDSYMDYIFRNPDSVVRHWLGEGASGWRLDVADELPDEFIRGIRSVMRKEFPDSILLGEVWEDASNKTSYGVLRKYFLGDELQSVMNYPFRTSGLDYMKGIISAGEFCAILMSLKENYPKENYYACLNLIGSHDRARVLSELSDSRKILEERINDPDYVLNEKETEFLIKGASRSDAIKAAFRIPDDKLDLARDRLKVLSLLQFVLPGVPCIYYGDEAGMQGFEDPYNRGTFPWGNEDEELQAHYHMLCTLRKENPVLITGDFIPYACTEHVICFERYSQTERFRLFVNRGIFEYETVSTVSDSFTLPPLGWKILTD